jgi:hypothetical protein
LSNQGSTYIETWVVFNATAGSNQISEVAQRLVDLDADGCLHIEDDCVDLVGQSVLGTRKEIGQFLCFVLLSKVMMKKY